MRIIYSMAAMLLLLAACAKQQPYYALPSGAKELVTIKPGSFIVMEDSLNPGTKDSFVVSDYGSGGQSPDAKRGTAGYESMHCELTGQRYILSVAVKGAASEVLPITLSIRDNEHLSNNFLFGLVASYPTRVGYNQYGCTLKYYHPTVQMNGKEYTDVFEVEGTSNNTRYNTWYNRDNALIRLDLQRGTKREVWRQTHAFLYK